MLCLPKTYILVFCTKHWLYTRRNLSSFSEVLLLKKLFWNFLFIKYLFILCMDIHIVIIYAHFQAIIIYNKDLAVLFCVKYRRVCVRNGVFYGKRRMCLKINKERIREGGEYITFSKSSRHTKMKWLYSGVMLRVLNIAGAMVSGHGVSSHLFTAPSLKIRRGRNI